MIGLRRHRALSALISASLLIGLGACSSSSKSSSTNSTSAAGSATTAAAGSTPESTAGATGSTSKTPVKVGLVVDATGILSAISGPGLYTMEAAIAEYNDSPTGKYHITYKVYDDQGSPAGGLTAARQAISDHVFGIIAVSVGLDSGLATLAAAGVPTVGNGDTVNWSHRPGIFSYEGNEITQNTTGWMDLLINQGRKNIAIPTGPGYGAAAGPTWNAEVPFAGGKTCFYRTGIDASNSATLTAVAHEIISAGCQGVDSLLVSNTVGLQVTLNQLGGNVQVVDPGDFGPAVTSQYGASANGLIYANFFASPYATGNPGVNEYLAAMKKYEPTHDPYCFCTKGYAVAKWFTWALDQVPSPPTQSALVHVLDSTNGYNADGLIGPIREPAFHSSGQLCLGASVIKNGKWMSLYNGPNAMVCGRQYVFTKS
jgi:ABC-type branched-subunit amino acid transport system substrate-binding protein